MKVAEKLDCSRVKLTGSRLKRQVLELLRAEDFNEALKVLCSLPARRVINPLLVFLCHSDGLVRWRAVTAVGAVLATLADKDPESARVVMRRMMWNLNDESGGIGWGMPEAMGEAMARHEGLAREYAKILISYLHEEGNFLEYEPLQRGALWALGRLAQARSQLVQEAVSHLPPYLTASDPYLRALAAWAAGLLRAVALRSELEPLSEDQTEVFLYLNGEERLCRIGNLVTEALARADCPSQAPGCCR